MPDFDITPAERIGTIWASQGKQLNDEITEAFPDNPDMAFVVAIGLAIGTTLSSFSDPGERATMVDGINTLTRQLGYALTPVN